MKERETDRQNQMTEQNDRAKRKKQGGRKKRQTKQAEGIQTYNTREHGKTREVREGPAESRMKPSGSDRQKQKMNTSIGIKKRGRIKRKKTRRKRMIEKKRMHRSKSSSMKRT